MSTNAVLLSAALRYAALGWAVLPLYSPQDVGCSCGRTCSSPGKHPRTARGVYAASREPAAIRAWWRRWTEANIGIATGPTSGLVVLDFDPPHGGLQNLERLQRRFGPLPDTLMACSGSGGLHLYFACPPGVARLRNTVGLAKRIGVDVRVQGGFIVAPPSLHASGSHYGWLNWGVSPTPLPESWVRLLAARHRPRLRRARQPDGCDPATLPERWLAAAVRQAQPGQRNRLGFWLACRLVEAGVAPAEAEAIMRHYAEAVGRLDQALYTEAEALASLRSASAGPTRDAAVGRSH